MEKEESNRVNRQYKDRLFKLIFREKEDLLQLYNAINNTEYDNVEDIEVNTIEDVVYMGMKNDISFLIKDILNLYEHQSTFSPNLPLRGLFYFADLYKRLIGNKQDIYSSRLIRLPYPQFVVFYNGTKDEPERQVLQLSDAFPENGNRREAAIQCQAVVLNINLGYNSDVLKKCKKLKEYAQFIACIRAYLEDGFDIREAIDTAVDGCIKQGILEELLRNNREEVRSMLLTEYDEEAHIKSEREIALKEGEAIGLAQGIKEGEAIGLARGIEEGEAIGLARGIEEGELRLTKLVQRLLDAGRSEDVELAVKDEDARRRLYKEFGLLDELNV